MRTGVSPGSSILDSRSTRSHVKVSVVMPARNEAHHVEATLASLLQQTRQPDEIVVADGESSDGTLEKVKAFGARGLPIRIVKNGTRFAGGGRNAATTAARNEILVCMDFGNRADPAWLEEMTRPFEEDPSLDYLGGIFLPIMESRFEKVFASCFYTIDCLIPAMERERIEALAPDDFIPGGMCMAYRRSIWERAGGFAEWSRKGQDRLFGRRIRRIGGKVAYSLDARVMHHMPRSMRALIDRHYHYELWAARQGLSNGWIGRVAVFHALVLLALVAGATRWPWSFVAAAGLLAAYIPRRTWRNMRAVSRARSTRLGLGDMLLAIPILLVFDAASLAGWLAGTVDRLVRPRWRVLTNRYLEGGC